MPRSLIITMQVDWLMMSKLLSGSKLVDRLVPLSKVTIQAGMDTETEQLAG